MRKRLTRFQRKAVKYTSFFVGTLFIFMGSGSLVAGSVVQGFVFVVIGVILFLTGCLTKVRKY